MPLHPRPLPPADAARASPDETPSGFRAWSSHIGEPPASTGQAGYPLGGWPAVDWGHPMVRVAAVAFVGYTLARLIHRI